MEIEKSGNSSIKEQVEQKLQAQQANKDFKDIGRVSHTKKERSAYKLISGNLLDELETDAVMAYQMVKKDGVWPEINIQEEKDRGVTSGATYLKVKLREAIPTRPKDEKAKRATYVMFLEQFQSDLKECFTVSHIKGLADRYRLMPMDQIIGYFMNPDYLTADEETKKKIEAQLKSNRNIATAFIYGSRTLVSKLINEVFGARFENAIFNKSDAAGVLWHEAYKKEPISEEESAQLTAKLLERKVKFIEANNEKIEEYRKKTIAELIGSMDRDWSLRTESKKEYKKNPEKFREWAISYYERRIRNENPVWDNKLESIKPQENDWSWFESPASRAESTKPKSEPINTKAPLSFIKRTGGYKVETTSPAEIVDKFGFSAVNYGVYVDDKWSKEHTHHFLGAMTDMAEILNINIKEMNQLGKLAIAFGAKGRKGHAAAYFPQTKDINLTRGNGDGSLAHEWGHYFDNVIVELDKKIATNQFASDGSMPDYEIKILFKELMDFYYKGNPLYTPKVPMTFYAKKSDTAPVLFTRTEQKQIVIKSTIEETLAQVESLAIVNKDYHTTQVRIFGYIIDAFGLESYEVPMTLRTSYVFHKSAYNMFRYCFESEKGVIIGAIPRSKYWTSAVELFARAWETVILKKLTDAGRASTYLVSDIPMEDIVSESYFRPYPSGKELDYIETIIDRIIIAVKKRFAIGDFSPPSGTKEDEYLDLSENGKVSVGMVVDENPKTGDETVEFVGAIATLEMLIEAGGSVEELAEWKEAVETLRMLSPEKMSGGGQIKTHVQFESAILETVGKNHYLRMNGESWKLTDDELADLQSQVEQFSNPLSAANYLLNLDKSKYEKVTSNGTVFTKDGVELNKGTQEYKGHVFYDENGKGYECLGYFPKLDDCVYKDIETGNEVIGCMDGFYFNNPAEFFLGGLFKRKKKVQEPKVEYKLDIFKDGELHDSMILPTKQGADIAESNYKRIGYTVKQTPIVVNA